MGYGFLYGSLERNVGTFTSTAFDMLCLLSDGNKLVDVRVFATKFITFLAVALH